MDRGETGKTNPYALAHQSSARARAKAYMKNLISSGAATANSSFTSSQTTSSSSSSMSPFNGTQIHSATLPRMANTAYSPAPFTAPDSYPTLSFSPPAQQRQPYAQNLSSSGSNMRTIYGSMARPVNGATPPAAGDITMMVPNRKLSTGKKYVTARQMRQQVQGSSSGPSQGLGVNPPSRKLNIAPKQTIASEPTTRPNALNSFPPKVETNGLLHAIGNPPANPSSVSNRISPVSPIMSRQGRLYEDIELPSSRSSADSGMTGSASHVRHFQNNHASIYTYHEDGDWIDEDEQPKSPSSPRANRKGVFIDATLVSPTASTVLESRDAMNENGLSPKQEASPPLSAPTSPRTGMRKRAFSNNKIGGTFESPVASLLGRLDQALTVALARVDDSDPSYTPVPATSPELKSNIFQMLSESRKPSSQSSPALETESNYRHGKDEVPDQEASTVPDVSTGSEKRDSRTSSISDFDEEVEVMKGPPPIPPPRSISLKKKTDAKRIKARTSKALLRKPTRERLREKTRSLRSSRQPSPTPSTEFRLPDEASSDQFRLDLDFDAIQALVNGDTSEAPEDDIRPQTTISIETVAARTSLPSAAPVIPMRESLDAHLASISSVEKAILAVEEDVARVSKNSSPPGKTVPTETFAEKRKVRQSVVRRLDGVLLEAMEATGDFFDDELWDDDNDWEDVEEASEVTFDETTEEPSSLLDGGAANDDGSAFIDDYEIESWRRPSNPSTMSKSALRPRPEVGDGVVPAGGRISTPDLAEDIELSLPRRHLNSEDLSKTWRSSGMRNSGEKPPFLRLSNSSTGTYPGPLSPLQPVIPKPTPTRRNTFSPKPEALNEFLYKTTAASDDVFVEDHSSRSEAGAFPSMSRSLSSPQDGRIETPAHYVPPLPNEYQFATQAAHPGTFGSLARRYQKTVAPESNVKPLNRNKRVPIISIDSTATSGDVGGVWTDFASTPWPPQSAPATVDHGNLQYKGSQTFTLPRGGGGYSASSLGRNSVDSTASSAVEGTGYKAPLEAGQGSSIGRRPSLFSRLKKQIGGSGRRGQEVPPMPKNIHHPAFLDNGYRSASNEDSFDVDGDWARDFPRQGSGKEGPTSGGRVDVNLSSGIPMSRSKSAGTGFGKIFGKNPTEVLHSFPPIVNLTGIGLRFFGLNMADILDAGLSKQQFRWKVFETLQESGITDRLKSQLRAHIVNEIRNSMNGELPTFNSRLNPRKPLSRSHNMSKGSQPDDVVEVTDGLGLDSSLGPDDSFSSDMDPAKPKPGTLMNRVVDSLVIDYLRAKGSEFTLSVFMPECGLTRPNQVFAEEDIFRALHLDQDTTLLRKLVSSILIRVLSSLSQVGNVLKMEREVQTDIDDEEYLEVAIRKADQETNYQNRESNRRMGKAIEDRMQRYQNDLETRMKAELEQQLAKFKEIEVASMRVEERQKYTIEITRVKGDYEARLLEQRERMVEANEDIRRKLDAREKEIERSNLEYRQRILDENNRSIMTERNQRSEAELSAKSLTLERDSLQRRLDEAKSEISELHGFKDRYTAKMQESIAQYKIDLNKEHAGIFQAAQIERAKIETEKLVLDERNRAVEQMMQQVKETQNEFEETRLSLKETRIQLDETMRERDDALHEVKELKLQIDSQKTSTALEFEIQSLKMQLIDAEKMAIKRQEDYQSLLKSLMGPKEETQKELIKARKSEQKWQRQCSELVGKLDMEMNRADELQRKLDDEVIRSKELLREISDLRNVLHQTRAAMGADQQHLGEAMKSLAGARSSLPDPFGSGEAGFTRISQQPITDTLRYASPQPYPSPSMYHRQQGSIHQPLPQPFGSIKFQYSPDRNNPSTSPVRLNSSHPPPPPQEAPTSRSMQYGEAWSQGYERMETLVARSGLSGLDPREFDRIMTDREREMRRYDSSGWDWVPREHAPQPHPMTANGGAFSPYRQDVKETPKVGDGVANRSARQDILPEVEGLGSGFADDVMQSFSADTSRPPPAVMIHSPPSDPLKTKAAQPALATQPQRSQLPVPSSSGSSPMVERRVQKSPPATRARSGGGKPDPSLTVHPTPSMKAQGALKESPTTSLEEEITRGREPAPTTQPHQRQHTGDDDDVRSSRTDESRSSARVSKSQKEDPPPRTSLPSRDSTTSHQTPPPRKPNPEPTHQTRESDLRDRMRRLEEEREKRDRERRERERAELDRIRREREEMVRKSEEEEERRARAEEERVERERIEKERREEEERREAERREVEEREKRAEEEKMRKIEELENDPVMQKYMGIVKEKREKEANVSVYSFSCHVATTFPKLINFLFQLI
ncbi:oxidative DNA demethylase [Dinochytrium kinnereticum]|nr:oxidative DNA demethylase [Dinochytrium kinnereticum]